MKEYDILYNSSISELIREVNSALKDGWSLCGGVADGNVVFCQAMYRDNQLLPAVRRDEFGEEY